MMSGDYLPWDACSEFVEFCTDEGGRLLWANAPSFDIVIMRSLFRAVGQAFPVHFSRERDFRTIRKLADDCDIDYSAYFPPEEKAHSARVDAVAQAKALQLMLNELELG